MQTVIDINPAKQEKYLPASGLKVQSPEQGLRDLAAGLDLLAMNGNYVSEIRTLTHNQFKYLPVDNENV